MSLVVLTSLIVNTALYGQTARKHLENIHPERNWTSLIGCFQGLIKATGNELPRAAAMGLSGHAFRLEVDPKLRPDGMARINFDDAMPLYKNLGFDFDHFYGWLANKDETPQNARELNDKAFHDLELKAQMKVRESLSKGMPAIIAYRLFPPEYGIVVGFNDLNREFTIETHHGTVSRAYGELFPYENGNALVNVIIVKSIRRVAARGAERMSLQFAANYLRRGQGAHWQGRVESGLSGYDAWIAALEKGKLSPMGNAILALTAYEARRDAAVYLKTLAERFEVVRDEDGKIVRDKNKQPIPDSRRIYLEAAHRQFSHSATSLERVAKIFHLSGEAVYTDKSRKMAVTYLTLARKFEFSGAELLDRALKAPEWDGVGSPLSRRPQ